jgi:hypothetical protein
MKDNKTNYTSSLTFLDVLCLVFIVLKLTHVINWSWWIVLAPIWGSLLLVIVIILILCFKRYR